MRHVSMLAAAAAVLTLTSGAWAAEVEVKLVNKGADGGVMVFEPAFLKIAPADIVKFVATDKGHNVENIRGMLPEGVAQFVGKTEEDVAVKFDREGVYGVKCPPHYGICMVVMIVEGIPANVEQAKTVPQVSKAASR
jgi:pseudoazurin